MKKTMYFVVSQSHDFKSAVIVDIVVDPEIPLSDRGACVC